MRAVSSAFDAGGTIPTHYANVRFPGGRNTSIPIEWIDEPEATESFAVVMTDRAPSARGFIHWVVANIPASVHGLPQGASGGSMPTGSSELENDFGAKGYGGPQPPAGTGAHEYALVVHALDVERLDDPGLRDSRRVVAEIEKHTLDSASYSGTLGR